MAKSGNKKRSKKLVLEDLRKGMPGLTPVFGAAMSEAGAVCLEDQSHSSGVVLRVSGGWRGKYELEWSSSSAQMRRTWKEKDEATEFGACGISILLVCDLVGYTVIERSMKGSGFDFWLGHELDSEFQKKARLEVSGIRQGQEDAIRKRVRRKIDQTDKSDDTHLPALVSVIEFSSPSAKVVRK